MEKSYKKKFDYLCIYNCLFKFNMSWVITRHLFKSGSNNISCCIGRYNNFSSYKCQQLKNRAKHILRSKKYKDFTVRKTKPLYDAIDEFINRKILYIDNEWSAASSAPCREPYWKAKEIFYEIWSKSYAEDLTNVIFKNCLTKQELLNKFKYKDINSDYEISSMFQTIAIIKINQSKKYNELYEKMNYHAYPYQSLILKVRDFCMIRWTVM